MSISKIMKKSIWTSNPIAFQVLGVCSALAVTVQLKSGLVMGLALTFVVSGSNVILSLMRHYIPHRIRIIVELAVISSFVSVLDLFLQAYFFDISKTLSVFVGLIITNCIVMGRAEAFALANDPVPSFWDGIGNGTGYALVLIAIASFREVFGSGSLFEIQIIPESFYDMGYSNNGLVLLPPSAFILLGLIIWSLKTLGGAQGEE